MLTPEQQHQCNVLVELHVFGNDLKARDVDEFVDCIDSFQHKYMCADGRAFLSPAWMYANREGQPWQTDIEAHVANWRRQPRPFCTSLDLCWTIEEELIWNGNWDRYHAHLRSALEPTGLPHNSLHARAMDKVEAALRAFGAWPL